MHVCVCVCVCVALARGGALILSMYACMYVCQARQTERNTKETSNAAWTSVSSTMLEL